MSATNTKGLKDKEAPKPSCVRLFRHDNDLTIAKPGHYERLDKVSGLLPPHVTWADDHVS